MSFRITGLSLNGGLQGRYEVVHDLSKTVVFATRALSTKEGSAFARAAQTQFASVASVWTTCKTKAAIRRWFMGRPEDFWRIWEALKCFR